ncbi:hypothetical protein [Candidatus Palauibacter sp.]|uniref:hypothetical protein n=1 Tax=Candidatus Palauibacter sp. TaxID=3101350 RepID=UPI003B02A1CA
MRKSSTNSLLALCLIAAYPLVPDTLAGQAPDPGIRVTAASGLVEHASPRTVKPVHTSAPSLLTTEESFRCAAILAGSADPPRSRTRGTNGTAEADVLPSTAPATLPQGCADYIYSDCSTGGGDLCVEACGLTETWYEFGTLGSVTVLCNYRRCGKNGIAASGSHSFMY